MGIFRGIGGTGNSTDDGVVDAVTEQAVLATNKATEAANSASSASTSATNASNSATSASTSATTATTKASEASNSATSAATSATSAATSATSASTSATTATTKASEAATSATNAATSETNAATSATTATTKASEAATSATTATTKAGEASTSATNAASSATSASTSASTATTKASEAATSAVSAALSYDSFDDRYLGAKSSAPSVDNDGDALITGALYFDTSSNAMKVYSGSAWLDAYATLSGALIATNNLSDLNNVSTARTNLGLGTAATTDASAYATAAQADQTVSLTGSGATSISGTYPNFTITSTDTNTTYSVGDGGLTEINFTSADNTKLDGIESGATADQTASEILTAIKTVDGSGSGLDADTVDGIHATNIVESSNAITSNLDTFYDAQMFGWTTTTTGKPTDNYGQGIGIVSNGKTHNNSNNWITQLGFGTSENSAYFRSKTNSGSWGAWKTFWHSGNDGSGSGLDADLFQGYGQTASGNRWGVMAPVGADGVMEIGRYIDFHETDGDTGDNAIRLDATSTRLRLTTASGYVDIGPQNTSYSHFSTDRGKFYFNKRLIVDEGIISSYDDDLVLQRASSSNSQIKLDSVSNVGRILVKTNSYGAGFQTRSFYGGTMFAPSDTGDGIVNGFAWSTGSNSLYPARSANTSLYLDNVADLGLSGSRWDDIYATNGTIQTSDAREKQDIEALNEAEQRVAVAAKGLLRKFRWKDKVEAKGDDARIHFGIIAQDLEAAFTAEGLDPSRYAMFIKTEWWVGEKVYPAIAEEVDEEGNVITEAVEESTDPEHHYDNQADAPADAVYHYRMGIRYSELLAFIISAI